jgi:hypothetical protein
MPGTIRLFYKAASSTDLHEARFDGSQWSGGNAIRIDIPAPGRPVHTPRTDAAPAAVATSLGLLLFYKGDGSNGIFMSKFDGVRWSGDQAIISPGLFRPPETDQGVAVTVFRNFVFLAYKSAGSNDIGVAALNTNGVWQFSNTISALSHQLIHPKTDARPSVAAFNDRLLVIYKGVGTNDLFRTTFDGAAWTGDVRISSDLGGIAPQSTDSPGLAAFQNRLWMIYKGPHDADLNYASFDGAAWHGNSQIANLPGGIRPQSSSNPALGVLGNMMHMYYKSPGNNDLNYASFDGATWFGNSEIRIHGRDKLESNTSPAATPFAT